MFKPILALSFLATPALADDEYCNDMWFVRNQIFDRAGYCFKSPLGQAMFDNSDCTGGEIKVPKQHRDLLAYVKHVEADLACKVDTRRTTAPVERADLRLQLHDLAALDEYGGAGCFGYQGPVFNLHAGHDASSPILGQVKTGDDIRYLFRSFNAPNDWIYTEAQKDGETISLGWSQRLETQLCDSFAG